MAQPPSWATFSPTLRWPAPVSPPRAPHALASELSENIHPSSLVDEETNSPLTTKQVPWEEKRQVRSLESPFVPRPPISTLRAWSLSTPLGLETRVNPETVPSPPEWPWTVTHRPPVLILRNLEKKSPSRSPSNAPELLIPGPRAPSPRPRERRGPVKSARRPRGRGTCTPTLLGPAAEEGRCSGAASRLQGLPPVHA